ALSPALWPGSSAREGIDTGPQGPLPPCHPRDDDPGGLRSAPGSPVPPRAAA
ncbi:unnamed protein product, partial [Bubo scandiacus]